MVYSTNEEFNYNYDDRADAETLPPSKQNLRVLLDKSGRAGKQVTLVTGFVGRDEDIDTLARHLKAKCGVGGSVKDGEIIIQGDHRDKIVAILVKDGYKAKRVG